MRLQNFLTEWHQKYSDNKTEMWNKFSNFKSLKNCLDK